jgi:hypothetical protein
MGFLASLNQGIVSCSGIQAYLEMAYLCIEAEEKGKAINTKTVLHVGPGHRDNGARLPPAFQGGDWKEIRLDIDPVNEPDIVGSMLNMAATKQKYN